MVRKNISSVHISVKTDLKTKRLAKLCANNFYLFQSNSRFSKILIKYYTNTYEYFSNNIGTYFELQQF